MTLHIIFLVISLFGVVKSADWFLGAAEKIGVALKLPSFILGVILVGFGTSLPEMATTLAAITDDVNTVTVPNIMGSNIANIFIIIGISTIILGTIRFEKNLIDLDMPLLVSMTALFTILLIDGSLSRSDGYLLLLGFVGYLVYSLYYKEDEEYHQGLVRLVMALSRQTKTQVERNQKVGTATIVTAVASIVLLAMSSKLAVDSLLSLVTYINVGVGILTFFALAIGTSLPELVVSLKALRKGQGDVVVGNIIGSCMFNILLIGGVASIVKPQVIDSQLLVWSVVGMVLSVSLLVIASITRRIHLWEGFSFLLIYVAIATKIIN